jgi:hypothetical protein
LNDIDTIIATQYDANATPMLPFGENNPSVRALDADRLMTQRGQVFDALLDGDRLNGDEARRRWCCKRLAARIGELRKAGYRILSDIGPDRCAVYWMPQDEIERVKEACQ